MARSGTFVAMSPSGPPRTTVFISYDHRDGAWLDRVRVHLKPLEHDYGVEVWDDTRIRGGATWRAELAVALRSARVALLLVSADFLASDFIVSDELPALLDAARREGLAILPLIVSPSRFTASALARFQAVNDPARPLVGLPPAEQEAVLVRMTDQILGALCIETGMRDYVSPRVLTTLREDPTRLHLMGQLRRLTLLRTELRGFTTISEVLDPETLTRLIHDYLTALTGIVFELDGTLDRYAGHALTAYWGAPVAVEDAADRACTAALRMADAVRRMNPELVTQGLPPMRQHIAITTGNVLVGNLGSDQRFNYSIAGDTVDVLERLVRLDYQFSADVLVTEFTRAELRTPFETRLLSEAVHVLGKTAPIAVFALSAAPQAS